MKRIVTVWLLVVAMSGTVALAQTQEPEQPEAMTRTGDDFQKELDQAFREGEQIQRFADDMGFELREKFWMRGVFEKIGALIGKRRQELNCVPIVDGILFDHFSKITMYW